ncbi:FadR/GntR family transcriptional regulator [Candidatus Formimonas warabiya]|uniref:HTH gntR-type domain-containing protein n=1 Tax=Formimonas warabiya TaxID=1761012 RepID=A0A3G1KMQ9_FORW1|nr:FadR/GntR family transcriptional regulator [Candidatus Formimonas warabiya]ATW23724.1 hypothetical protein DCMF_01970 [Candidatus Formimonas warabiya]
MFISFRKVMKRMTLFSPIEHNKAFIQIARQIRNQIESGNLNPGNKLPSERNLAESFQTSRPTIREALRVLEIMGLTESRVGQGTFIKAKTLMDIDNVLSEIETQTSPLEIFEARLAIETFLVKLAAKNATKEDINHLSHYIDQLDELDNDVNNYTKFVQLDNQFHERVALAANNTLLAKYMQIINNARLENLWETLKRRSSTSERLKKFQEQHQKIFAAIKDRDSALAEKYMIQHILYIRQSFFEEEDIY